MINTSSILDKKRHTENLRYFGEGKLSREEFIERKRKLRDQKGIHGLQEDRWFGQFRCINNEYNKYLEEHAHLNDPEARWCPRFI